MEEIKLIYASHLLHNLKYFQSTGTGWLHNDHRQLLLKWQWHFLLVREALVALNPCAGSEVLNPAMCSEDHQARAGRAAAPSECVTQGHRLLCAEIAEWVTGWDVICALRSEVL